MILGLIRYALVMPLPPQVAVLVKTVWVMMPVVTARMWLELQQVMAVLLAIRRFSFSGIYRAARYQ